MKPIWDLFWEKGLELLKIRFEYWGRNPIETPANESPLLLESLLLSNLDVFTQSKSIAR